MEERRRSHTVTDRLFKGEKQIKLTKNRKKWWKSDPKNQPITGSRSRIKQNKNQENEKEPQADLIIIRWEKSDHSLIQNQDIRKEWLAFFLMLSSSSTMGTKKRSRRRSSTVVGQNLKSLHKQEKKRRTERAAMQEARKQADPKWAMEINIYSRQDKGREAKRSW